MPAPLPQEHRDKVIALYTQGLSSNEIGARLGITGRTVRKNLNHWGAQTRPAGGERTYELHEDYFDKIDTQEKAYWLGFIAADGCIGEQYGRPSVLVVGLAEKDRQHLEKLKECLGYTGHIYSRPKLGKYGARYLQIGSKRLCCGLGMQGCKPRKTQHLEVPVLPADLVRHWIRGFFDGDGCITKGSKYGYSAGFCGLPNVLEYVRSWAVSIGLPDKPVASYSNTAAVSRLTWGSREAIARLALALYDGATISLGRKKSLFLEALS
jgi:hypothetical protein